MPTVASLLVRIGAKDQEIQNALANIGQKAKSLDADLSKLGDKQIADKANKSLEVLRATLKQVTDEQGRVAARAQDLAAGLNVTGGAARLTDTQLRQVHKTLQEGVSAFRALGQNAPADLQRVADAVASKLDKPLGAVQTKILALGTAIGTFLGNAAIGVARDLLGAAKASFDYADALSNLSVTTGITVEGLQRLEALGVTSGVSMETLAGAVSKLQIKLNDPAAIRAIRAMGLNYAEIRKLKPEEQFLEIAKSVARIEDPVARANAGAALFGQTWQDIAPAIQGDIQKIIDQADILSTDQVEALDKAGDAWDAFANKVDKRVGQVLGNLIILSDKINLLPSLGPIGQALDILDRAEAAQRAAGSAKGSGLPAVQAPTARIALGPIVNNATDASVELFGKTLEEQTRAAEAAITAAEKLKQVQNQLFGRAIIANANQLVAALGSTDNISRLTAEATKKLHQELGEAISVYKSLGDDVPPKLQEIYDLSLRLSATPITVKAVGAPSLEGLTKTFITYGEIAADGVLVSEDFSLTMIDSQIKTNAFGRALKVNLQPAVRGTTVDVKDGKDEAISFGDALTQAFSGKGVGGIGKFLKGSLGDLKTGIFEGFENLISGGLTTLINKGIGLLTAGFGKLFGKLFGTAGRDAVREFAATEGGFDSLHDKLLTLGDAGEQLWIKLTQGVGRNNAAAAKAAIDEVTAALERNKEKFAELQTEIGTVTGKLTGLTTITPDIQAALDAVFAQTTTEGRLDAVTQLNAELDKQAQKYTDIQAALDEFNIKVSDTGKEFQQAKLNERAVDLEKKFDLLRESGVDINVQMRAMGSKVRDFIADAKKAGLEVPESMRRIIQTAIDAGEVFDQDGKKITNIEQLGLTFGTTMESTMKTVGTAVDRLNLILEGLAKFLGIELPKAAQQGAEGVSDALAGIEEPTIDVNIRIPEEFRKDFPAGDFPVLVPDGASRGAKVQPWGLEYFAHGGFARGRDTIPAMVSPGELIINTAQQENVAAALTRPSTFEFHAHGPVLAEDDYLERKANVILRGIERYFMREFERLQLLTQGAG